MPGIIAAGSEQTAVAGAKILAQGGNAVDAAVAATFTSFISEIGVVHLGGCGIAQIYNPVNQKSMIYDFFGDMPGLGNNNRPTELDFSKVTIDFGSITQDFHLGRASVATPSNIFGLCQLAADHGRLPLAQLLQPAIDLAESGLVLDSLQASICKLLAPLYLHTPEMRTVFEANNQIIQPGHHLHVPNLANTLRQLATHGPNLLRHGSLAQALVADQEKYHGLLTSQDLRQYQVLTPTPISVTYREFEVLLPPLSSIGGILIAFSLTLLHQFNPSEFPHRSTIHLQLLYEIMAATTRARLEWERLINHLPVTEAITQFLSPSITTPYLNEIKEALASQTPSQSAEEPPMPNHTSHLSVIDEDGLAVGLTTTAGESAGYLVPGTGFIPNNILGESDLHPQGFHTQTPGTRINTMMTPTIVRKKGKTHLVVGTGGSTRIRSAILQLLNNTLDYHLSLKDAVDAPRVHLEEDTLQCELGYLPKEVDRLESYGYSINRWEEQTIYFGGTHSVIVTPTGLVGAGDPRRGGFVDQG